MQKPSHQNNNQRNTGHTVKGVTFKVKEVVEVREATGEKWSARIVAFKKDTGHVILQDIRRSEFGGQLWRDEDLIHKIVRTSSKRLQTY